MGDGKRIVYKKSVRCKLLLFGLNIFLLEYENNGKSTPFVIYYHFHEAVCENKHQSFSEGIRSRVESCFKLQFSVLLTFLDFL